MKSEILVSEIQITPIKPSEGLVAFASCVINNQLYLGSLGIHKKLNGSGYRLTYPTKRLGDKLLNYYHPITKELGRAIEESVVRRCEAIFEKSDEKNDRYNKASNSDD